MRRWLRREWTEPAARNELANLLARVRAGIWAPPERPHAAQGAAVPTFHEYASWWLVAKKEGALGRASLSSSTAADYSCRLQRHLLPFFAEHRIDAIDRPLCERSKQHKLREAQELPAALEAGADIRDRRGRRAVPLGPASLRKLVDCLAAVLDEAIEDRHIETNPARSHRMKVRVPKPRRTFLEIDELAAILDAAAFQDGPALLQARMRLGPTASMVAGLLGQGLSAKQIAGRLGIAQSTVSYHVGRIVAAHGATPAGGSSSRSSVAGACAPASCAR